MGVIFLKPNIIKRGIKEKKISKNVVIYNEGGFFVPL